MLRTTLAAAAALVAASFGAASTIAPPTKDARDLARAADAYAAMQRAFAAGAGYRETAPAGGPASAWSFSQALAATISLAELPHAGRLRADLRRQVAVLTPYWDADGYAPYPGGGAQYYDDNEWLGQDLLRAYAVLHDRAALARAERIFAFVATGWDRNAADACPGGVFWTRDPASTDRNTVSTANGALLALGLYRATGREPYLRWARAMTSWVDACLRAPDGLYWDHLSPTGAVERREWSYNQGAMLAAFAGLFAATGDDAYRGRAEAVARAALARYAPDGFAGEPACFVAIFFRDLAALDAVAPDRGYDRAAQRYADALWAGRRDPATGLFPLETGETRLLDQAAVVDLYAQLAR